MIDVLPSSASDHRYFVVQPPCHIGYGIFDFSNFCVSVIFALINRRCMSSGLTGAKHEHYPVLRQLLVDALVQRRYSEAEKIYAFLERTQFIDRDPQFMFKVQTRKGGLPRWCARLSYLFCLRQGSSYCSKRRNSPYRRCGFFKHIGDVSKSNLSLS